MAEAPVEVRHDVSEHHGPQGVLKYLWSTDHKIISMQYLFTGMFMAVIGGFMAYVFRMQLAFPGSWVPGFGIVSPGEYNSLVTNHGPIMLLNILSNFGVLHGQLFSSIQHQHRDVHQSQRPNGLQHSNFFQVLGGPGLPPNSRGVDQDIFFSKDAEGDFIGLSGRPRNR